MRNLDELRKDIDVLDLELLDLLVQRIELVKEVGAYKRLNSIDPYQPDRWKKVLNSKIELGEARGLSQNFITDIWNRMHEEALDIERKIVL